MEKGMRLASGKDQNMRHEGLKALLEIDDTLEA